MSSRYAPLPNAHTDPQAENEMEAAFDDSDDELEDDNIPVANTRNGGYHSIPNSEPLSAETHTLARQQELDQQDVQSTTYDFDNVDYDYIRPPPGSPPGPSARALPNEFGNTNGYVPSFGTADTDAERNRGGWLRRTAASVLPSHYLPRLGLAPQVPTGAVGGGTSNDGVFANVTAKPSAPIRMQEGDETLLVPEETSKDAPPSYATAQADSVPPYWETTIHAPSSNNTPGEMIIDSLPTGSLFSFLWNMLVSISFTFIGFLLTYLLHTTHAAKLGSRAGLGVTLIQYGFAMRTRADDWIEPGSGTSEDAGWNWKSQPKPTFETAAQAEEYYRNLNETMATAAAADIPPPDNSPFMFGDVTTEWLSFFLMTVGWFILLTSLLGFWRVKRWERSILSTQQHNPPSTPAEDQARNNAMIFRLERAFGIRGLVDGSLVRTGLGFPGSSSGAAAVSEAERHSEDDRIDGGVVFESRGQYVLPLDPNDEEHNTRIARAVADEVRLQRDLRAAGLL
ncbi:hypothetical protein C8Q75DRAFT_802309 [Abortiporus biennis]|nr:hypothetical protein C8Q75DRAFT_802309 [Abortiporus biennis]